MSTGPEGARSGRTDTTPDTSRNGHPDTTRNRRPDTGYDRHPDTGPIRTTPHSGEDRDHHDNAPATTSTAGPDRREVLQRQKEGFGGIKWGAALFGWLTATGTALLLTALAAAAGTAFGLAATSGDPAQAVQNPATATTAGIVSAIVVLVILLVAYYCGGYVAGRMARFSGMKQGIAVWLWSIVIAIIVAGLAALAGSQFDILATLNGLPRLPINEGILTTVGIITALVALAAALIGAMLGGLAGMRYHRTIDRAGFER